MVANWREIVKLFVAGMTLGCGPCLLVCLPIVLPYIFGKETDFKTGLKLSVIFSSSRVLIYSLLGLLSVVCFRFISGVVGQPGKYIKLATGVFIVIIGIIYLFHKNLPIFCRIVDKYISEKTNLNMFVLGVLIALSPCAPLAGILVYIACTASNAFLGLVYGFSFGIGTFVSPIIPAGALTGLFSGRIKNSPRLLFFARVLSGLLLIYFGINLISLYF